MCMCVNVLPLIYPSVIKENKRNLEHIKISALDSVDVKLAAHKNC